MIKRGQAGIVSAILLILIVVAAIVIVSIVINTLVKQSTGEAEGDAISIQMEIQEVKLWVDGNAKIKVHRGAGEGDLTALRFIFYDKDGASYIKNIETDLPDEVQTKTYTIVLNDPPLSISSQQIDKISIVPVLGENFGIEVFEKESSIKKDDSGNRLVYLYDDFLIPAGSLVSWWEFADDHTSGEITPDSVGENDGTLTNDETSGEVLVHIDDSVIRHVNIPDPDDLLELGEEITLLAWVETGVSKSSVGIIKRGDNAPGNARHEYTLSFQNAKPRFIIGDNSASNMLTHNIAVADSNWHMIVGTLKDSYMKLYVDGNLVAEGDKTVGVFPVGSRVTYIGATAISVVANTWVGSIDDVMIFNKALNINEIKALNNTQGQILRP